LRHDISEPGLGARGSRIVKRLGLIAPALIFGAIAAVSPSYSKITCKPIITVKEIYYSDVRNMQRTWNAVFAVDGSYCATTSGPFEIDFVRLKENAPDLQFTQEYEWRLGEFKVSLELWQDEFVQNYRVGFIASCVCQEMPY
jgi:hypothetical protein